MDPDKAGHKCGVVGIISSNNVAPELYASLRIMQHRGQNSAGIAVSSSEETIKAVRGLGLAHEVFNAENLSSLSSHSGIGHVRYPTTGDDMIENVQPLVLRSAVGDVALGHNGDIVNSGALRDRLENLGWAFFSTTDTELVLRLIVNELRDMNDPVRAIRNALKLVEGGYAFTLMIGSRVFGIRDPLGIRPLALGKIPGGYAVASESVVFDMLDGQLVRDFYPGEIIELTSEGYMSYPSPLSPEKSERASCMFEYVYFARPDSVIDGKSVFEVRRNIGRVLAREHPVEADVVIPVPDSGRTHAIGYCEVSGIPLSEGLMKNRFIERTFIMPEQGARENTVSLKLNPLRSVISGKRVVIIDDSIVRGTTMRKIVQMVRKAGATEVHVRIGCPMIVAPCYYGVDMKTRDQFIATGKTEEEVAREITADSLGYLSINGLVEALGMKSSELCLGCLTAEYPTRIPGERMRFQRSLESFQEMRSASPQIMRK
ncbi:MAG: amidophosphoribosyltransferase [Candidatus Thermoplasmatota archaeon]|nr:amidophosphoribosyltransferase [Candidatus Thermoplasmatota archaeon]